MDVSALNPVAHSGSPQLQTDLRPSADAIAAARDPSPNVPLPPTFSQQGVVSAGMLRGSTAAPDAIAKVEAPGRTLKPFGVTMLPSQEARDAARDAAKAEADAAEARREAERADDLAAEAGRQAEKVAMAPEELDAAAESVESDEPAEEPEAPSEPEAA